MKTSFRKKQLMIALLVLVALLSGCRFLINPPSSAEVREFLRRNQNDIDVIVSYLKTLETDSAYINNDEGVFYEFEIHNNIPEEVKDSIRKISNQGCSTIGKNKSNTVFFEIWYTNFGDADCGFACTIDGQGTPKTEFQIYCEELGNGWFYFYDDYEEYRSHPSKYKDNQPFANATP